MAIGIKTIVCGPLDVNSYLAFQEGAGECIAIDPADDAPLIREMDQHGLTCTHILLTHGHFDHIGGVAGLKERYGAEVLVHEADAPMLENDDASMAVVAGFHVPPSSPDLRLKGGEALRCAGIEISALHTPGHSPGGMCYILEDARVIFTGDTLFRLSVGRADFAGGDERQLYHSIKDKLFALPGDYTVYPGHMRPTTLDFERKHNPFMRGR